MQKRRRTVALPDDVAYEMPEPVVDLIRALQQLSPHQRAAAILRYFAGYTLTEISELLGSSPSAVGVHLYRARRRLRRLMKEDIHG
jgi:RNA polymerase sigma factor (sigma-70 family)